MQQKPTNQEHQLLLEKLADPKISKWEKSKIRKALGIFLSLTQEDFKETPGQDFPTQIYDYIADQFGRLRQKDPNFGLDQLPADIRQLYFLWGFGSVFESSSFRDYRDHALQRYEQIHGYSLRPERDALLEGLESLGLRAEKQLLEDYWTREASISDEEISQLQEKFWDPGFKQEFNNRLNDMIRRSKTQLLGLQQES